MHRTLNVVLSLGLSGLCSYSAFSVPMISKQGSLTINWGTLRTRVEHTEKLKPELSSYDRLLSTALTTSLLSIMPEIEKRHLNCLVSNGVETTLAQQSARMAADVVTRNSYIITEEYFKDGVSIVTESSFAMAMQRSDLLFVKPQDVDANSPFSGVLLKAKRSLEPVPMYRIVDENGQTLFSIESMTKEGYNANLMGRWFQNPTRPELIPHIGSNWLVVEFDPKSQYEFMIERRVWNEISQKIGGLLAKGKLVVATPAQI